MTTLTAADVSMELLTRARHLHACSYFLLESSLGPGLPGLLAAARERGLSSSLDTNDDPAGRWGGERLRATLAQADVFLPNEAEALATGGRPDLDGAVAALARAGRSVVVKLGPRGALCVPAQRLVAGSDSGALATGSDLAGAVRVMVPPVRPADTTGAGDCFSAGLIAGLLRGLDLANAAALGCAVGAASTQAPGGTGVRVDLETALGLARAAVIAPAESARS